MEYKVLMGDSLISEEQLNDFAVQGWRLVTIVEMQGRFYVYFVRAVVN